MFRLLWILLAKTKVVSIRPGDIIIVNIEKRQKADEVTRLTTILKEILPDNRVIVPAAWVA